MPDTESEDVMQLEQTGRESQSFVAIAPKLQPLCFVAQAWVSNYTYFYNLFVNSFDMIYLINDAWEFAQDHEKSYLMKTKLCATLVSHPQ